MDREEAEKLITVLKKGYFIKYEGQIVFTFSKRPRCPKCDSKAYYDGFQSGKRRARCSSKECGIRFTLSKRIPRTRFTLDQIYDELYSDASLKKKGRPSRQTRYLWRRYLIPLLDELQSELMAAGKL